MNAIQELRDALGEYEFRGTDGAAGRLAEAARALLQAPPAAAVPEVLCTRCGHPTMHMGSMCYGCTQAGMLAAAERKGVGS